MEPERERDPDSDAESMHEGDGYCQMMRVVIAGKGPVVKGSTCNCLATGQVCLVNEDVVVSDVSDPDVVHRDGKNLVWGPACD